MYTIETRYTWFSSFRNVSRANGRKRRGRRGHGSRCANVTRPTHPSTREGKIVFHVYRISKSGTLSFSLGNRSRSDSHTSPPPHRWPIKRRTPNVEELVSLKPEGKKKKNPSQAALYGHRNNRSAEYIRYRADFSSGEVCAAERASRSRKQ